MASANRRTKRLLLCEYRGLEADQGEGTDFGGLVVFEEVEVVLSVAAQWQRRQR